MKICTRCHAVKSYELFYKQAVNSKDGYQAHCKTCDNKRKKNWTLKNPDLAKVHRHVSDANRYKNHKSYINQKNKKWKISNPEKVAAMDARRRAALLNRTPCWLTDDDHWVFEQAYELAQLRTNLFGFAWHVDHVIPLQGKLVSGLHTPYNLQVIPGRDNMSKSNLFTVS
jgi:hypothetical protein